MWQYNSLYHGDVSSDGRGIRSHKYIAKVTLANGTTRYFYDRAEYNAYKNKQHEIYNARRTRNRQDKLDKEWDDIKTKANNATVKGKITSKLKAASKTVSDLASKGKSFVDKLLNR